MIIPVTFLHTLRGDGPIFRLRLPAEVLLVLRLSSVFDQAQDPKSV